MTAYVFAKPGAEADLAGILDDFVERSPARAEDLLAAIERTSRLIARHPKIFRAVHGDVRRAPVRGQLIRSAS